MEPLFEYLGQNTPELRPVIAQYWAQIDPELGILYKRRQAFEQSTTLLNDAVANYLDEEDAKAQAMFPHYFQRFKTDGVEHNIYVGAALVEDKPFDLVFLKNLRLWQLLTMVEDHAPHRRPQGLAARPPRNHPAHPHPQPAPEHPFPPG